MIETAAKPTESGRGDKWKWFLAVGGVLIALGIAGFGVATLLELTSLAVFGPMLLASSLFQFLTAMLTEKGKEGWLHLVAAGVEAILGFVIMAFPPQTLFGLMALVAFFLMAAGLVRLARAASSHARYRAVATAAGLLTLLLGASLWVGWPVARLWFVGLCLAIDFICHGVSWSALAWADRGHTQMSRDDSPWAARARGQA